MAAGDRDSNNRGYRSNRIIADSVRLLTSNAFCDEIESDETHRTPAWYVVPSRTG